MRGSTTGIIKGDTRSLDCNFEVRGGGFRVLGMQFRFFRLLRV